MKPKNKVTLNHNVTPDNLKDVMDQAIALELATIPTYLSTYYSINRAPDQDILYAKLKDQLTNASSGMSPAKVNELAQELKLDILTYANKSAALIMSVLIEEMLHMALASNVKTAVCQEAPNLLATFEGFSFPTELVGHEPEFEIDGGKLSLEQLTTFLKIESPEPFVNPNNLKLKANTVDYKTIGRLYKKIDECIQQNFPGPYKQRAQLLPPEENAPQRPFYNQNSMNTVYYDREHNPHFASQDDSGVLVGVHDAASASKAIEEIVEQGEGQSREQQHILVWGKDNMPVPLTITDGKAQFWPGDYDDEGKELSHFAKFLEAYSFGVHYKKKFSEIDGLDDFFSYFVYNTKKNATQQMYDDLTDSQCNNPRALATANKLGSALSSYLFLMVETCYYSDESTQFDLFMYGIHKSMIWLLSGVGNQINAYEYEIDGVKYKGSLTWEGYTFDTKTSPKSQIMDLVKELAAADPAEDAWGWAVQAGYDNYFPALPDVSLDHKVTPNVPEVPKS